MNPPKLLSYKTFKINRDRILHGFQRKQFVIIAFLQTQVIYR
jgi:hypothetical protein